ncbi:Checkpoint serine/threonine-protein kinase BUB1 [Sphaceloma murrayae]|uniref:Checkpoint serine/threonine-protein kinase BUB1 n=1 Tax=Sphaceloma murrayae TaxID=2082308 RepID=A0A2K1R2E0_9PEZI|nr:Checkpoint serine/threonine-protein kinase BUB1 [Sphaceloma murrayae]
MAEHTSHHESDLSVTSTYFFGYCHDEQHARRHASRRRICSTTTTWDLSLSLWTLLVIILTCFAHVNASAIPNTQTLDLPSGLHLTATSEVVIYDRSTPPTRVDLARRADGPILVAGEPTSTPISRKEYVSDDIISDTSQAPTSNLPTPFDTTLGNNFTSSQCLPFFQSFLSNATFNACLPFSLLLQTSSGFFQALRSPALLTRTLDATCNVNVTDCSLLMSTLNTQLRTSQICGPDLSRQNPVVVQAASGFAAYDTLYRAACLQSRTATVSSSSSSSTTAAQQNYCFASAATNTSAPDSLYTYFLPLGMKLPRDAHPSCNACLRDTMAAFAQSATVKGQAVAGTYLDAASTVGKWCGEGFAREDVRVAAGSSGAAGGRSRGGVGFGWGILILAAGVWVM